MRKKYKITVEGRAYTVEVEEIVSDLTHPTHAPAPSLAEPHAPTMTAPAPLAAPAPAAPAPVAAAAPAPAGAGDEVAPLAGVVDSIEVKVGQAVAVGDKIATIEAMKMKTEVFAKNAGTVTAIAVKAGQSVDGGQTLLTLG